MFSPLCPLRIDVKTDHNVDGLVDRSGHRIVANDKYLYCWGGYNPQYWHVENNEDTEYPLMKELWRYQIWTGEWKLLETHGEVPTELASHTVILIPGHILHFGGTGVPFGQANTRCLYDLDLNTLKWKRACDPNEEDESINLPRGKYGHSMVRHGNYLYVMGGTCGFVYDSDVHQLNLKTMEWKDIPVNSDYKPEARYRHEIIYYKGKLLMFGGGAGVSNTAFPLSKIDVFDLNTQVWESVITVPHQQNIIDNNSEISTISKYPGNRRCHSCVRFEDDVFVCGGLSPSGILKDVWKFHLPTLQWTEINVPLPKPVYFHSAATTNHGCMYIFGGVTRIDDERTNALQIMWLHLPQLKLLAFNAVLKCLNITRYKHNKETLLHIGIPNHFVDLIV
ncbi:Kelch domain-containing protein 10 [Mactra antiquata]